MLHSLHFSTELMSKFYPRDLNALSSEPLLVFPTHYIGDEGYISDTELTTTIEGEDPEKYRLAKDVFIKSAPDGSKTKNYKVVPNVAKKSEL